MTATELLESPNCAFVCTKCGEEPRFTRRCSWGFNMADAVCVTPGCVGGSFQAAPVERPMLSGYMSLLIGHVTITEPTEFIDHCPTYYAADSDNLRTVPGTYPVYLTFKGGYSVAFADRVSAGILCNVLKANRYSGFGGVNYSCDSSPAPDRHFDRSAYSYELKTFCEAQHVEVLPQFQWMIGADLTKQAIAEEWNWETVKGWGGKFI